MTYEEIERALEQMDDLSINGEVDCCDVLNYIKHLKADIERYRNRLEISPYGDDKIDELEEALEFTRFYKENARKETAKEILQDIKKHLPKNITETCLWIAGQADKYGVEIDE